MENTPFGFNPESSSGFESGETSDKSSKEKSSKKKSLRAPLGLSRESREAQEPRDEKPENASEKRTANRDTAEKADKADKAETAETTTPPPEQLTPEETQHANEKIAQDHLESMEHTDAATNEELEPAVDFLEKVTAGEDVETAFSEVAAEMGLSEDEIAEALAEGEPEPEPESEFEAEAESAVDADSPEQDGESFDAEPGDMPEDDDITVNMAHQPPVGGGPGGGGPGAPGDPGGFGPGFGPVPAGAPGSPYPAFGNRYRSSSVASPNLPPAANEYYRSNRAAAGQLLLVGLVGYLIGRRRGRIKIEKRLMPTQRKLERQVATLEQNMTLKEQQLVAAKARAVEAGTTSHETPVQNRSKAPAERGQPGRQETRLGLEKPQRVEHLGQMVMAAEAPRARSNVEAQRTAEKPRSIREAFKPEAVKTMRRAELLELSEKIVVEGASLRQIHESRLIGETQLRHLVSEYLQGKDIRRDLRREMIEHEIDYERDPLLRDRAHTGGDDQQGGGLRGLLERAGVVETTGDAELQQRMERASEQKTRREQQRHRQRMMADTAMATAILGLAIVVVVLVLAR